MSPHSDPLWLSRETHHDLHAVVNCGGGTLTWPLVEEPDSLQEGDSGDQSRLFVDVVWVLGLPRLIILAQELS